MIERKPIISVVYRNRKRIRIHRVTLHLLGDPECIQLLVNPEARTIAIKRGEINDHLAIRVYPLDSQKDCFEIRSSVFVKSLNMICDDWEEGQSYRLYGELDAGKKVAIFKLDGNAQKEGKDER